MSHYGNHRLLHCHEQDRIATLEHQLQQSQSLNLRLQRDVQDAHALVENPDALAPSMAPTVAYTKKVLTVLESLQASARQSAVDDASHFARLRGRVVLGRSPSAHQWR